VQVTSRRGWVYVQQRDGNNWRCFFQTRTFWARTCPSRQHKGSEYIRQDFSVCVSIYPDDNSKRQKVVGLMEQAKAIAAPLRTLLKSQKRIRPNQQPIIKTNLCRLWLAWRKNGFPHGLVFNKLHHVVAHVIRFIKKFEMYGRVSEEEGFEAAHLKIESTKAKTKSMISNQQRVAVECRRIQILMNPRISEINKALHPEPTRQGPYNKQYRTRAQDDHWISHSAQCPSRLLQDEVRMLTQVLNGCNVDSWGNRVTISSGYQWL
jgi:hypothetical protein